MPIEHARISTAAMSEVRAAFKVYCQAVAISDLSFSSQAHYVDLANNFVRWLEFEFEPGSRKAPYVRKKVDKALPQQSETGA